jgi:hypothetical protein
MLATTVFILILFLPAACLPLALDTFFSSSELGEMGVRLETSDDTFRVQGYELVGFLPTSSPCETWEINEPLQICQ